jgi:hypothetical protein
VFINYDLCFIVYTLYILRQGPHRLPRNQQTTTPATTPANRQRQQGSRHIMSRALGLFTLPMCRNGDEHTTTSTRQDGPHDMPAMSAHVTTRATSHHHRRRTGGSRPVSSLHVCFSFLISIYYFYTNVNFLLNRWHPGTQKRHKRRYIYRCLALGKAFFKTNAYGRRHLFYFLFFVMFMYIINKKKKYFLLCMCLTKRSGPGPDQVRTQGPVHSPPGPGPKF